jgi:hypothetical protein
MKRFDFRALCFMLMSACLFAQGVGRMNKYPNELTGYKFFQTAVWNTLEPLESTTADVDRIFGKSQSGFRNNDDKWGVLVHFVGEKSECNGKYWPSELTGKLSDITLRPKVRVSFLSIKFPTAFKKGEWYSSHAIVQVDGYSDENGLTYFVYRDDSPDGTIKKGDLQSIVYSYSRKRLAEKAGCQ